MNRLAEFRIRRAIRAAEAGTTGHIAVRIVPDADIDAFARAREEFESAGLHNAPHRNASLILIAPAAKKYAVLGDREMHAHVGDAFWQSIVSEMQSYLAKNNRTGAILHAIDRIGHELHKHFPVTA